MSNITAVQNLTNCYGSTVTFANTENDGNKRTVVSGTQMDVGNAWIPWCDNADSFGSHHMSVTSADGRLNYALWQSGGAIYYTNNGAYSDQPNVLYGAIGLGVVLTVWSDGSMAMSRQA